MGWDNSGLDKLDPKTGVFTHVSFKSSGVVNELENNIVFSINEDQNHSLWIGTGRGVNRLDSTRTKFKTYLTNSRITCMYVDAKGIVWAGAADGLYHFDKSRDQFLSYTGQGSEAAVSNVLNILEDNDQNLWVSAGNLIMKINAKRDGFKMYREHFGVHTNTLYYVNNFKSSDGELFLGDQSGYYAFFPNRLQDNIPPQLSFFVFKLGGKVITPAGGNILKAPVWQTQEIRLRYDQNVFSFDFIAMHYDNPGNINYLFMLENYDDTWHNLGTDHTAYLFNIPPGNYIFHAKAIDTDGTSAEKTIRIVITPPWWRTWWAYFLYAFATASIAYIFYNIRIRKITAMYKMRTDIARDLHDEIGSTLTSISVLSKISGQQMENDHLKAKGMINEISEQSLQIQQNMSDIVWAINPENDKLQNMLVRMRE